ncbi:hypothetical protein D8X84_13340 [Listeria innocua]|nr:hypothetical protein [Listeria innocua]
MDFNWMEVFVWRAHFTGRITYSFHSYAYLGRNSLCSNGPNKNTFLRLRKERALSTGKVERQLGCAPNC